MLWCDIVLNNSLQLCRIHTMSGIQNLCVKVNASYLHRALFWLILTPPNWETQDLTLPPRLASRTFQSFRHITNTISTLYAQTDAVHYVTGRRSRAWKHSGGTKKQWLTYFSVFSFLQSATTNNYVMVGSWGILFVLTLAGEGVGGQRGYSSQWPDRVSSVQGPEGRPGGGRAVRVGGWGGGGAEYSMNVEIQSNSPAVYRSHE